MKANFNLAMVRNIAIKTRQYKKLFVTTKGVMFLSKIDCEEAVRVQNVIIGDPADFVGYLELTEGQFSDARLRSYAKDVDKFNELFENSVYPRQKAGASKEGRKREEVRTDEAQAEAEIDALLGEKAKEAPKKAPKADAPKKAPKADAPKVESSEVPAEIESSEVPAEIESSEVPAEVESSEVPAEIESSEVPAEIEIDPITGLPKK